jgi:ribosomal protein L7/L12
MSTWSWFFLGIVVVLLLAMLLTRRANSGVDPTQLLLDPDLVTQVRALAVQNQKVTAIKMLRDGTPGLSLASAKVMVDRMAAPRGTVQRGDAVTGGDSVASVPGSTVPAEVREQARTLRDRGDAVAAIGLVRQHLPGLQEAKKYVEGL